MWMRFTTQRQDQKHNLMVTDSELLCNKESVATKVARSISALSQSSSKDGFWWLVALCLSASEQCDIALLVTQIVPEANVLPLET